jgi:hypothetical protein
MTRRPGSGSAGGTERAAPDPARLLAAAEKALAHLPRAIAALAGDLDPATWRARPAPDKWAPLEIICHLRDEETEDFGARMRVVLAGGGHFAPIRPAEWVSERDYIRDDPEAALAAFTRLRRGSLDLLAAIESPPARLLTTGESPGGLVLSGLDILAAWVAHDELHIRQLAGTLARLWAIEWAPLRADYAGELPYPGPE